MNTTFSSNPWRTAVIVTAILVPTFLAIGAGAIALRKVGPLTHSSVARQATPAAAPAPAVIEDCNRYAEQAKRDTGRIVKNGVVGGAVGAGAGAAGGAIADGGKGAGKGAGIGAIVGGAIGTLYGLNEENKKSEAARAAYGDCLARRGY
jgi:hypothetical protein